MKKRIKNQKKAIQNLTSQFFNSLMAIKDLLMREFFNSPKDYQRNR